MKKYVPILIVLIAIKLIIHLIANQQYGFHRDELLHLSVSEHLDSGYMEFPPFIAWIGKMASLFFEYSLSGIRFFATLAGIGVLIICCAIAKEFGGKRNGILLAGVTVLAFLPFYRNHTLFQPVAFDQFFWALAFYYWIRFYNSNNTKYWYYLAFTIGLGILNKYTMLVWCLGFVIALPFYEKGKLFKNKGLYIAGCIALLMVLPNIIWQMQHHFPLLMHMQKLKESQLDKTTPFEFVLEQLQLPFTLVISLFGLWALFIKRQFKKYKSIGIAVVVVFFTMWMLQSKAYYFFAVYPVLFAAGAVYIEKLLERKPKWNYAIMVVLLVPAILLLPEATPILPIDTYVKYKDLKPDAEGRFHLKNDYADMFGWDEQVRLVDSLYRSLSPEDRKECMIMAENYGEAGAIKILGKQYNLPDPVCAHGSFWLWGTGTNNGNVAISIGNEKEVVEHIFEEVQLVKTIRHQYAIDEENSIPLYLCRKPKIDIKEKWKTLEKHVFD